MHKQSCHIFEIHVQNRKQSNKMERFNGTLKERYGAWQRLKKTPRACCC